jgi:Protein of unknown function (DUF2867)
MISEQVIPPNSEIARFLYGAHFHDCFVANCPWQERSALEIFLSTVAVTPVWVNTLMRLRNWVVGSLGLKNLGVLNEIDPHKAAQDYRVGDRVGIFTLLFLSDAEVVLGDTDKHLQVRVSVIKLPAQFAVCTVVHEHNMLGKIYMLLVKPMHKLIVPAVMRRALAQK